MTDPKRWTDDDAPMAVRALLTAARDEEPARAGMERTLVALGVGGAVATGTAHAAGAAAGATAAKSASSAGTLLVVAKWSGIGALAAVSTLGTAVTVGALTDARRADTATEHRVAEAQARPARAPNAAAPAIAPALPEPSSPGEVPLAAFPGEPSPVRAASRPPRAAPGADPAADEGSLPVADVAEVAEAPPEPPTPRMLEEVRAIDRAREALVRGDSRGVLDSVRAYFAEFPERRFAPEAFFLEMEARARTGDRGGAREVAERLVSAYPRAPQAARARLLLSSQP